MVPDFPNGKLRRRAPPTTTRRRPTNQDNNTTAPPSVFFFRRGSAPAFPAEKIGVNHRSRGLFLPIFESVEKVLPNSEEVWLALFKYMIQCLSRLSDKMNTVYFHPGRILG